MKLRPWAVPLIPFLFSLTLSASTAGSTVFWQDSGFYLTAVHEFSVLYPHGFVLYLAFCKAWTWIAAPLFGFTGAVHAFSALCAAGAAACLALAARAALRRVEPEARLELPSIGAACLVAAGYSFWHSALLAKTYALYYLALAALLALLAAAERKRDFVAMGAVLGLAWAAHPSAALLLPAMLVYAWARRDRIRDWGWPFFAGVVGLAAVCAIVPSLFLPMIGGRPSPYHFDVPRDASALVSYLRGERFTDQKGAFGLDGLRLTQAAGFVWEEYLGVSLILLGLGAARTLRTRPAWLALLAAWLIPVLGTALAFRAEGQLDMWLVVAYLPLSILLAAGLLFLGSKNVLAQRGVLAASLVWLVAANAPDLNQRHYAYAEQFGRFLVKPLEPRAFLFLSYDDSIATVSYVQAVRGERKDVGLVIGRRLGLPWYDVALPAFAGCRIPDWERSYRAMPGIRMSAFELNAFANENVAPGRPLYCEIDPDARFLRRDLAVVPAGMLWKIAVREEATLDPKYWDYPVDLLDLSRAIRRPRGVVLREAEDGGIRSKPEPYENRLLLRVLSAKLQLADRMLEGTPQASLDQYELARRAYPPFDQDHRFLLQWGMALALTGHAAEAEPPLRIVAEQEPAPRSKALSCYYLAELARAAGRKDEARSRYQEALRTGGLDDAKRTRAEEGLKLP